MNKQTISKTLRSFKRSLVKHSPEILTGIGVAGLITTSVLTGKAVIKANKIVEEVKHEMELDGDDSELTTKEVVGLTWKYFVPPVVTGAVSICCVIGATSVNAKRNAALATAYQLSQRALIEYKDKVVETIGEKKERNIREKIAEDHIKDNPVGKSSIVIMDKGGTLCYDAVSGRYFESDIDVIKRAVNTINYDLTHGMMEYVSLNEFYDEIGLPHTSLGDELGWNISDDGPVDVEFFPKLAEDDRPCVALDYRVAPHYDFSKLM